MSSRQVVPEGLALMAPGPELAVVLAGIDVRAVSGFDVVEVAKARQRQLSHDQAMFLEAVVESGARSDAEFGREPVLDEFRPSEVRAALSLTRRAAEDLYWSSRDLLERLPAVHAAMVAGEVDPARAEVLRDWTQNLTPEQARTVCELLLPIAAGLTVGQLIDRIRKLALAMDPAWTKRCYDEAVTGRKVVSGRNSDGSANVEARNLALEQAAASSATLSRLARAARRAGDPRTLDQLRADLFGAMTDGSTIGLDEDQLIAHLLAHRPDAEATAGVPATEVCAEVEVRARLSTLLGDDEYPGEIARWGPIHADHARKLVAKLGTAQWRYALTDMDGQLLHTGLIGTRPAGVSRRSGARGIFEIRVRESDFDMLEDLVFRKGWNKVLLELHRHHRAWLDETSPDTDNPHRRGPAAALRRYLHTRDGRCFFPSCRAPASGAQIDHTIRWTDDGPTLEPNLGAGCVHDHRLKDEGGWAVTQLEPGRFHWTSRLGHEYRRERERVIEQLPEPKDRELPPQWTPPERDNDPEQMLTDSRPPLEPEIIERPELDYGDPPF